MNKKKLIKQIKDEIEEVAKIEFKAHKTILWEEYEIKSWREYKEAAEAVDIDAINDYQSIHWTAGYIYGLARALKLIEELKVK